MMQTLSQTAKHRERTRTSSYKKNHDLMHNPYGLTRIPHGVTQWRLDRYATLLMIPATPILIVLLYLWQQNFVLNLMSYLADINTFALLSCYLVLTTFFNLMSLKAIIHDYVKSIRMRTLCWFMLTLFVTWLPLSSVYLLARQVWQ